MQGILSWDLILDNSSKNPKTYGSEISEEVINCEKVSGLSERIPKLRPNTEMLFLSRHCASELGFTTL